MRFFPRVWHPASTEVPLLLDHPPSIRHDIWFKNGGDRTTLSPIEKSELSFQCDVVQLLFFYSSVHRSERGLLTALFRTLFKPLPPPQNHKHLSLLVVFLLFKMSPLSPAVELTGIPLSRVSPIHPFVLAVPIQPLEFFDWRWILSR